MSALRRLASRLRERGLVWTALWYARWGLAHALRRVDRLAIGVEKRRRITGEGTVSSLYHTLEENRRIWNAYDWSEGGEEWTRAAQEYRGLDPAEWKRALIDGMMAKYIRRGSTTLEIGPGAGRWTEHLIGIAAALHVADISEKCLAVCRDRFRGRDHIRFHLIRDDGLSFLEPDSILDAALFGRMLERHGLEIIEQDTSLPHKPGDVITVLRKPAGRAT